MLGLKLKCTRKEGKDKRFYQLDQEGLTTQTRLQVLACIETRFTQPEEKLDWESAINEAHGILPENDPLTQSEQASQPTARTPKILYRNEGSPASRNLGLESQGDREVLEAAAGQKSEVENGATSESRGERSLLARLTESLEYCRTPKDLFLVLEGLDATSEQVEDAIALQPTAPQRQKLSQWWEEILTAGRLTESSDQPRDGLEAAVPVQSEVEALMEALPFAETLADFASIIEGSPLEAVLDAIALQDDQPRRQQLTQWLQTLSQPAATPSQAAVYTVGQTVKVKLSSWADWLEGKISQIIEGAGTNLRVLITEPCFFQSSEVSVFSPQAITRI
jgi:hypothetical protein